jgi:hypothetical protein
LPVLSKQLAATTPSNTDDHTKQVKFLINKLVQLLDAWDCYLYTVFSLEPTSLENQIKIPAYQAGRFMAKLSWETERKLKEQLDSKDPENLKDPKLLYSVWKEMFQPKAVNPLQDQIKRLSPFLDKLYTPSHNQNPSSENTAPPATDPNKPSTMLEAIYKSLDYWMRAIKWFEGEKDKPSRSFTAEHSEQLLIALIQQVNIWQSLILERQTLQTITNQHVTHKILSNFLGEVEGIIGKEIVRVFHWGRRKVRNALVLSFPFIILLVLLIVIIQFLPLQSPFKEILTSIVSALGVVGGFFVSQAKKINVGGSDVTTIAGTAGSFGSAVLTTYRNGFERVQDDFASLNYNVSVASPLVRFFIDHFHDKTRQLPQGITSHYDFLVYIAWTSSERDDETKEIARSAFGAIGVLVGSLLPERSRRRRWFPLKNAGIKTRSRGKRRKSEPGQQQRSGVDEGQAQQR